MLAPLGERVEGKGKEGDPFLSGHCGDYNFCISFCNHINWFPYLDNVSWKKDFKLRSNSYTTLKGYYTFVNVNIRF